MPDVLSFYLNKIAKLRIDRARGNPAPHKPLLLLAVIDLIEQGAVLENKIEPSPQFVEAFLKYWNLLSIEKPRIFLPFYYLKSDKFWHLHARSGQENLLATIHQFKSMSQLASIVSFASLDEDLFLLLHKADTREALRKTIIETYFPEQAELFRAAIAENQEINVIENLLLENAEKKSFDETKIIPTTPKRSAAFRRAIFRIYNYTCAACHLRIVTLDGEAAVQAAHIFPFKQSFDDSIGNGISLCHLHHWCFDRGLFSIDDDYKIIVAANFQESGNENFLIRKLQANPIFLPKEKPLRPSLTMLRWHRQNTFNS
jgi:putative restriction endonuclease